jgi:hypothetical protein
MIHQVPLTQQKNTVLVGAPALVFAAMAFGLPTLASASATDPKCNATTPSLGIVQATGAVTVTYNGVTFTYTSLREYLANRAIHNKLQLSCGAPIFVGAHRMPHSLGITSQSAPQYNTNGTYLTTGYEASTGTGSTKGNGIVSWRKRYTQSGPSVYRAELLAEADNQEPSIFSNITSNFGTSPSVAPTATVTFPVYEIDPRYIQPVNVGETGFYASSHDNYWNRQLASLSTAAPLLVSEPLNASTTTLSPTDYKSTARPVFTNPNGVLTATSAYFQGSTSVNVKLVDIWTLMGSRMNKKISFQLHMHGVSTIPSGATYNGSTLTSDFSDYTKDGRYMTDQIAEIAAQAMVDTLPSSTAVYNDSLWFAVHLPTLCMDMYYYRASMTANTSIQNQIKTMVSNGYQNGSIGCLGYFSAYKSIVDSKVLALVNTRLAAAGKTPYTNTTLPKYYLVVNTFPNTVYNQVTGPGDTPATNGTISAINCAASAYTNITQTLLDFANWGVACAESSTVGLQILGFDSGYTGGRESLKVTTSSPDFDPRIIDAASNGGLNSQATFVAYQKTRGYVSVATDTYPDTYISSLVSSTNTALGLPTTGYCFLNINGYPQTLTSDKVRCPTRAALDRGSDIPYMIGYKAHTKTYSDIDPSIPDTVTLIRPDIMLSDHPLRAHACLQANGSTSSASCTVAWTGF